MTDTDTTPREPDFEVWRPVVGFESLYEVSDHGRVRSLPRVIEKAQGPKRIRCKVRRPERILRTPPNSSGYAVLRLQVNGTRFNRKVHKLVMEAFHGPCPQGLEVRHINGRPSDNRLENLAYSTSSENRLDQARHGTDGKSIGCIYAIRQLAKLNPRLSHRQIGKLVSVSQTSVSQLLRGYTYAHIE